MTHREQLQDQYEDALFALLMDDMAQQEGKIYEQENSDLLADPAFEIPERTMRRSKKTIRRAFRRRALRKAGRVSLKAFNVIAVAFFSAALLTTTALAASPQLRTTTLAYTTKAWAKSTDITAYTKDAAVLDSVAPSVTVTYLPEGFGLTSSSFAITGVFLDYEDSKGAHLNIDVMIGNGTLSFDTENAEVSQIQVNGNEATAVEKDGDIQIVWTDEAHNCIAYVAAEQLTLTETVQIAEGISIS